MDLRDIFIANIKACRKARGLSQMKLAELCGTSTGYIGEIEIGKKFPSVEMMQKIADALGVKPYRFFLDESDSRELCRSAATKERLARALQESVRETLEREFGSDDFIKTDDFIN